METATTKRPGKTKTAHDVRCMGCSKRLRFSPLRNEDYCPQCKKKKKRALVKFMYL